MSSKLALLAAVAALLCQQLVGQTTQSSILGDITDPKDASVAAATVVVRNLQTGVQRTIATDDSGRYRILPLEPGQYEVNVTAVGFAAARRPLVIVEAASQVKVDFQLSVGTVTEVVQVSDAAPILQTQDASVGGIVTENELLRLPVNGRNYTKLVLLLPGSSNRGAAQSQGTFSGTALYSVNGQRMQDNNFTLDGVDNNFMFQNSPGASPPMDSIAEFRVLSNTSAEFGRSSGANVSVVTKSGSRDLHGTFYEYLRNDKLDANDFFANSLGVARLPFKENQYGASAGGPVILPGYYGREHTFWFFNWEGFRARQGIVNLSTVPTVAQRGGDFSSGAGNIYDPFTGTTAANGSILRTPFAGKVIPASRLNEATLFYLQQVIPMPNLAGSTNNYLNTLPSRNGRDLYVTRIDRTIGSHDILFVRYSRQNVTYINQTAFASVYSTAKYNVDNLGLAWNHSFSPTSVLEVKFGLNRPYLPIYDTNRDFTRADFISKSGLKMFQTDIPGGALPALNATGVFTYPVGTGGGGRITRDTILEPSAAMSLVRGRHSMRFGFMSQMRHFFQDAGDPMYGLATFDTRLTSLSTESGSGNSIASMLLGTPSSITRASGKVSADGRGPLQALFFQDDFRLTRRLTVNLGLRYEHNTPPYVTDDAIGTLDVTRDPSTGAFFPVLLWAAKNSFTGQGPNTGGYGRSLQSSDHLNLAPRVGLAYQISSKTVVRSAFGTFYNSTFFQELMDKRKFYPYIPQQVITANSGTTPDLLITDPGPAYSTNIGGWAQSPHKHTPYSMQWNLSLQQEVARDTSWELSYFGSGNRHQIGYTYFNQAFTPGPGAVNPRRMLPALGDINLGLNEFTSNYNSMRTSLVKRYSSGTQLNVSYTWGKVLTTQSSLSQSIAQNQYDRHSDYGRADFDIAHVFQGAYVYDLPFGAGRRFGPSWNGAVNALLGGWGFEGIIRIQTGSPVNVLSGSDRANIGASAQRPNVLRNPNAGGSRNTKVPWFDTSAFQLPAIYTFGNAGVNIVESDGRSNWDAALQKSWKLFEKHSLQFRAETFNFLNHVNFGNPNGTLSSASFGTVNSATTPRQLQFALRYAF